MLEIEHYNENAFCFNKENINEINSFSSLLSHDFGISFVGYLKVFSDNRYLALANNLNWQRFFMQNICDNGLNFQNAIDSTPQSGSYNYLWPNKLNDKTFEALYHHNIWNGLSIYYRGLNYIESWSFATLPENDHVQQLYVNNMELFYKYIQYVKHKHSDILSGDNEKKFGSFQNAISLNNESTELTLKEKVNLFLSNSTIFKPEIKNIEGQYVQLSKQQSRCLELLVRGKTMKEIAQIMNIGARTVESYIENIKHKTGYHFKSELITSFFNTY